MKEKIAAIISFIGAVGGVLLIIFIFYDNSTSSYKMKVDEWLYTFLILVLSISIFFYVIWTKFGKIGLTELEQIEYENQLLKKKIEQQELLKKLDK